MKACVIYYGPNDLTNLVADRLAEKKTLRPGEGEVPFEAHEIFQEEYRKDPEAMLADASPINYINAEKKLPAFLFLSGDADPIIPLRQGIRFCEKVRACGGSAELYKLIGAGHGADCWTPDALRLMRQFFIASL